MRVKKRGQRIGKEGRLRAGNHSFKLIAVMPAARKDWGKLQKSLAESAFIMSSFGAVSEP